MIGEVLEVAHDVPGTLDVSDATAPVIMDEELIPEATEEELAQAEAEGATVTQVAAPLIGDPADPDYTETTITLYDNIGINTVEDATLRLHL